MADAKPTPTQAENDLAAQGQSVMNKEPDGSALDTAAAAWTAPTPAVEQPMTTRAMGPDKPQAYQTRQAGTARRTTTSSE